MSMTLTSRRELYKLRELVHFLLIGRVCCFCKKPLSETAEEFIAHGNAKGPKLDARVTIHHVDHNHSNNEHSNKALCHTSCHKGYHRRIANEQRRIAAAVTAGETK